jgi:putative FmdB family regulatory protein
MPIHEYTCRDCTSDFEILVRHDRAAACPHCGSTQLEKRLSVFATAEASRASAALPPGPCGTCGHPDGPGSCALQ